MEYFKLNEKNNFLDNLEKSYNSENAGTKWYFDTRSKLQYLISLIEKELNTTLINNYNEKPNGMSGQGKGFKLKHYVLAGFVEKKYSSIIKKDCFVKIQFCENKGDLIFNTDVDVNFSDSKNKHTINREKILNNTSQTWKVNDTFPNNWEDLVKLILPSIKKNILYLEKYILSERADVLSKNNNEIIKDMNYPLNQILYGPPGTGKTYNTINKALKIINDEEVKALNFDNREAVKDLFEKKVKENQIDFTTFHQSMSYEDFIEGIKPETKNEKVTYAVKDGIFKTITKNALIEYIKDGSENESNDDFENLYNDFIENIKPFEGKREGIFKTKTGVEIMLVNVNKDSILIKYLWSNNKKVSEGQHTFSVTKEKLKRVLVEGIEPNKIKNLKTELHPLVGHIHCELFAVYKKFYDFVIETKGEIDAVHFDNLDLTYEEVKEQFDKLTKEQIKNKLVKPYVFIIDEINRGNVSQIFGELITLIEDSKRLGKEEALEVTLPYSKEKFGVPPNLYIIGTMNTADRSVEALDTALRRRFSFVEMMPDEKVIEEKKFTDFDRVKIMQKINQRIEALLDRNYTLGHSYFIKDDFRNSFENEIIPLLQEYFYNDYGKIGLVLGKGFVQEKTINEAKITTSIFADFETKNEVDINKSYELIPFTEINFDEVIKTLLA